MKRRLFLAAGAGSLAVARFGSAPALAAFAGDRSRVAHVAIRRHLSDTGIPGACSNHGKRRAAGGYTLAYALSSRRFL